MKNGNLVDIRIPSEPGFEKVAMATAATMAALMGFCPERIEDLKTAVAEACINAIEHGNGMDDALSVGVNFANTGSALEIKVSDQGTGPDHDPVAPDIDRKMTGEEDPRGMGIFLIKALVDEADWHIGPPGNHYIRLVIRLAKETL